MPTILIVDDEPTLRLLVRTTLEATKATIIEAGSGGEAMAAVHDHRPDLIVLDWMMTGGSGLEVAKALRADPTTAGIPIMMLTVRGAPADRAAMAALGIEAYLTKPFSPQQMLDRVRTLLGAVE